MSNISGYNVFQDIREVQGEEEIGASEASAMKLPPEQEAIRRKCYHPSGTFVEFHKKEIEQSISERFENIVKKFPNHTAVKTGDSVVTYAELNAMANNVARAILQSGADSTAPIGILIEKGEAQISSMLGVLKAGRCFLVLDPTAPRARIRTLLEDSKAKLVISSSQNGSLAQECLGSHVQWMEFNASQCSNQLCEDLGLQVSPDALACIIYTSGSTGQPKGVIWNHRNWLHKIMLSTNAFLVCSQDRITLLASQSPNAITTIFLGILNGAAVLPFDVGKRGVISLKSWLSEENISFCLISSPLFRALCEGLTRPSMFPRLRLIRVASESVHKTDVELFKAHFSKKCIFATGLSMAETGYVRIYYIGHDTEMSGDAVPVGFAVEDKEIILLNDNGNPVGVNEVGEIVVRSRYLSSGYWNHPDLTNAKFKSDLDDPQALLYSTGDLGMQLSDGRLIHKGRKDFRVKVRGYGVDLVEVEIALSSHALLKEAVVLAGKNRTSENRLIAYYVNNSDPGPTSAELRNYLKAKLADYMIPSCFIQLKTIPLLPNGKIDRAALPNPGTQRPALATPFTKAKTPVEKKLVSMWKEVLHLDQIGIDDNFFDLGGDSLAATRIVSRVMQQYQLEIPLQSLFQSPNIAEMARVITEHKGKLLDGSKLPAILAELESLSDAEAERLVSEINDHHHRIVSAS